MSVITRAQWGARTAVPADPLYASEVVGLAFHWPAMTSPLRGIAAVSAALRGWQTYHMDGHGWRDIAYQVAVDQDGNRYILRGLDGESAANGDQDVNRRFGAVLLILAPGEKPSPAMIREVQAVVRDHRQLFARSTQLVGHQDVRPEPTSCPGPAAMDAIRSGQFEPAPPVDNRLRDQIRDAIKATLQAKGASEKPRRPRVRAKLKQALKRLREARDIEKG